MFKLFRKKNNIKAVYEDDLIKYLKSVGLFNDITEGKRRCKYCGNNINLENLEVIVPQKTKVEFICDNKNCLNQM